MINIWNLDYVSERSPERRPEHVSQGQGPSKHYGGGGICLQGPPDDGLPRLGRKHLRVVIIKRNNLIHLSHCQIMSEE